MALGNEELLVRIRGIDGLSAPAKKAEQSLKSLGNQAKKSQVQMNQFGGSFTGVTRDMRKWTLGALQQAGYQVGDFAVQVANGTSRMQAFGQQAPQLLQIFGPLGAAVGAAVAIFAAYGVAAEKSAAAAEKLAGKVQPLSSSISQYRTAVDDAAMSTDNLKERFGDAAVSAAKLFNVKAQLAQIEAVESLVLAGKELQSVFGVEAITTTGLKRYSKEAGELIKTIETLQQTQRTYLNIGTDEAIEYATELGRSIDKLTFSLQDLNRENEDAASFVKKIAGEFGLLDTEALAFAQTLTSIVDAAKTGVGENMVSAVEAARAEFDRIVETNTNLTTVQRAVLKSLLDQQIATFELVKTTEDFEGKASNVLGVIRDTSSAARTLAKNLSAAFSQLSDTSRLQVINAQINAIKSGYSEIDAQVAAFRKQKEIELGLSEAATDAERAYISAVINRSVEQHKATLVAQEELDKLNDKFNKNKSSVDKLAKAIKMEMSPEMQAMEQIAKSMGQSFEDAFMSMIDGTKSAKDAFKDMTRAIIADLYRQFVVKQITGFIGNTIASAFIPNVAAPSMGVAGQRAAGGPVTAGLPYLVGEKGPEIVVPSRNATVIPNHKIGGGGQIVVNQTINVSTGVQQTVRNEIKSLMPQIAENAKAAVADAKRRGGSYGRALA